MVFSILVEFIEGELLGDGCIQKASKNSNMALYSHGSKYYEYLCWLDRIFSSEGLIRSGNIREYTHKDNNAIYYSYATISCIELNDLYDKWYSSEEKEVPDNMKFTPTIVRQWFIGDGSVKEDGSAVRFSIDSFNEKSITILLKAFKDIGIEATVWNDRNTIYVKKESSEDLFNYMEKSFYAEAPCYDYKFDRLKEPMQCKNGSCEI